jgi:uncharacterized protein YyaL (SSP411 family)
MTRAAIILERKDWLEEAIIAFADVMGKLTADGGLKQSWLNRPSSHPATADGLANMIEAAIMLYQASADRSYMHQAAAWMEHALTHHFDDTRNAFCFTSESVSDISLRQTFAEDEATPNYNAVMIRNLTRMSFLLGKSEYGQLADRIIQTFSAAAATNPLAHAAFLKAVHQRREGMQAILFHPEDSRETPDSRETSTLLHSLCRELGTLPPVLHVRAKDDLPANHPANTMFEGRSAAAPALLMCQGQTCTIPVTSPEQIAPALAILRGDNA